MEYHGYWNNSYQTCRCQNNTTSTQKHFCQINLRKPLPKDTLWSTQMHNMDRVVWLPGYGLRGTYYDPFTLLVQGEFTRVRDGASRLVEPEGHGWVPCWWQHIATAFQCFHGDLTNRGVHLNTTLTQTRQQKRYFKPWGVKFCLSFSFYKPRILILFRLTVFLWYNSIKK